MCPTLMQGRHDGSFFKMFGSVTRAMGRFAGCMLRFCVTPRILGKTLTYDTQRKMRQSKILGTWFVGKQSQCMLITHFPGGEGGILSPFWKYFRKIVRKHYSVFYGNVAALGEKGVTLAVCDIVKKVLHFNPLVTSTTKTHPKYGDKT